MSIANFDGRDLPLGFGMALAQNTEAMKVFANMPQQQQERCIERAHSVNSKSEMQSLVQDIAQSHMTM